MIVRCRPLGANSQGEAGCADNAAASASPAVLVPEPAIVEVRDPGAGSVMKRFSVDDAFGATAKTAEVFLAMRGLARAAATGASTAIVAYGPTGAGKTHTMYGDIYDPGIVPRAAAELLSTSGTSVRVSMVELHNETLVDLLVPRGQANHPLDVRGGSCGTMATIEGARELSGTSLSAVLAVIRGGLQRRQVASTAVNATSSRSHVIVVLSAGNGHLTLVDLAGVERVKRSGATGCLLREARSINRSLHSLGDVVDALRRGATHVPCRNSRLARLISGALGGGAETAVLVCISPDAAKRDEAIGALCFAERVRRIPAMGGTH